MSNLHKFGWLRSFIMLFFVVGILFVFGSIELVAQGTPTTLTPEQRLQLLEQTVTNLQNSIVVIPIIAGLLVLILQFINFRQEGAEKLDTKEREKEYLKLVGDKQKTEATSAAMVDAVMGSVNQLLAFQAEQAKKITKQVEDYEERIKKYNPANGSMLSSKR